VNRWSKNFDCETDWNIVTEPMESIAGRQVKLSRGRFLGGSSGVNGTLCIRGTKQDYDDWGLSEWTGEKMFGYMAKVHSFQLYLRTNN
jgi:choline dehydrogenase-like flavoprotein